MEMNVATIFQNLSHAHAVFLRYIVIRLRTDVQGVFWVILVFDVLGVEVLGD